MKDHDWKDDILNSIQGAKRAEPSPFLFTKIQARIDALSTSASVSPRLVRLAFAICFSALVINVTVILNYSRRAKPLPQAAGEYSFSDDRYQLY